MIISIPNLGVKCKPCRKQGSHLILSKMEIKSMPDFMLRHGSSYAGDINGSEVTLVVNRSTLNSIFFKVINYT